MGLYAVLYAAAVALLVTWSGRGNWSPLHTLAAGGGAMMTYALTAFPQEPVIGAKGNVDLFGNTIFAVFALVLLVLAVKSERRLKH